MRLLLATFAAVGLGVTAFCLLRPSRGGRADPPGSDLPATSELVGRVTRDGVPVAAEIEIRPGDRSSRALAAPPPPLLTVRSAADGRFEASAPGPGEYELLGRAPTGGRGWTRVDVPCGGLRLAVDLEVRPGGLPLRGWARYRDGRPFAGFLTSGLETVEVAGVDGRFEFADLGPGETRVTALVPGRLSVASPVVRLPREEEFGFVVDEAVLPVTGRVLLLPGRTPVGGARLRATSTAPDGASVQSLAASGPDGRFALLAADGKVAVGMTVAGHSPAQRRLPPGEREVDFLLLPGATLSGVVLSSGDGTPASGIEVALRSGEGWGEPGTETTRTDADGRFRFDPAPAGPGRVHAGNGNSEDVWLDLPPGEAATVELRVRPAGSLAGRVVDDRGTGIPGALIRAKQERAERFAATDATGAFTVGGLEAGAVAVLTASVAGRASAETAPLLPLATPTPPVEIRLSDPRWIDVSVIDAETGDRVPDADVSAMGKRWDGEWRSSGAGGVTGPSGTARVGPLPAGPIGVTVRHEAHLRVGNPVPVPDPFGAPLALTVRLERGQTISGRVLGPNGAPAADGQIGDGYPNLLDGTIRDGSFLLRGVPPGRYRLWAFAWVAGRYRSGEANADAGERDVTIRLGEGLQDPDAGPAALLLLDPSGRPVLWAEVGDPEGGSGAWMHYRAPGEVRFDEYFYRSPCGDHFHEHDTRVLILRARSVEGEPLGAAVVRRLPQDRTPVEFRLPPAQSVTGEVRTGDGGPAAGVTVYAGWAGDGSGWRRTAVVSEARTDGGGKFSLGGLGPGEYRIGVRADGRYLDSEPVTAVAGAAGVALVARRGVTVRLTFLDERGEPVPGVRADCGRSRAVTGAAGVAVLDGLDPESREFLSASPPGNRPDLGGLERRDWTPGDETVRLERRCAIAGVVREEGGRPVANATIDLTGGPPGVHEDARTRSDGTFRIGGLREGDYRLSVRVGDAGASETGVRDLEVAAGTEDLVVTIRKLSRLVVRLAGWPGGYGRACLTPIGTKETRFESVAPEALVTFENVDPAATCAIRVYDRAGEFGGFLPAVRGDAGEVTVPIGRLGSIRGRLVPPEGVEVDCSELTITVGPEELAFPAHVWPGLTWLAFELPPGEWEVRVEGAGLKGEARVRCGESVDIHLRAP